MRNRGLVWIAVAFLFCPCHLPLTLWVLALLLSGTGAAVMISNHPYVAGTLIGVVWGAGTWRGIHLLRKSAREERAAPAASTG